MLVIASRGEALGRLKQASGNGACVLALHAHNQNPGYMEANFDAVMERHQAILDAGADDALSNLEWDADRIAADVSVAQHTWEASHSQLWADSDLLRQGSS